MSKRINTVLITGGTSAFARRFHGLGKKAFITGRNQGELRTVAQDLPGLESCEVSLCPLTRTLPRQGTSRGDYCDAERSRQGVWANAAGLVHRETF